MPNAMIPVGHRGLPQKKKRRGVNKKTKAASTGETSDYRTPKAQASAPSLVPRKKRSRKQTRAPHPTPALAPSADREKGDFECFPTLPIELRYTIWNLFSLGPRTVVINQAKNPKPKPRGGKAATYYLDTILFTISTTPPILHVCRESRQLGLETYRPLLTSLLRGMPAYFDWSQDTVHFADVNIIEDCFWHPKLEVHSKKWEQLEEETKEFKQNVRFISATGWVWKTSYSIELRSMKSLKTLFLEEQNRYHFEQQVLDEDKQYGQNYGHAWYSIFNEVIYLSERDMDKKVSDGTNGLLNGVPKAHSNIARASSFSDCGRQILDYLKARTNFSEHQMTALSRMYSGTNRSGMTMRLEDLA